MEVSAQEKEQASVKEVKDLKEPKEQLQNSNGHAEDNLLDSKELKEPQKAQTNDTLILALSSKPQTIDDSEMTQELNHDMKPMMEEPVEVTVKLSNVQARENYGMAQAQMDANTQKHKRTSLNHYMIESSITEEVREENISEKTSSERTSGEKPSRLEREDHVILQ